MRRCARCTRRRYDDGVKPLGLVATIAGVGVLLYLAYSAYPKRDDVLVAPAPSTSLGAPAPSAFGKDRGVTEAYTRRQMCLATCAADDRTCQNLAFEPPAIEACKNAKTKCDNACPSDARQ